MRESAVRNSPLPPSIEKAYHQKCIDLKRRLREIEEANEAAALRKARLDRSITKMRIMRAFLLEQLVRSQDYDDAESEKSESAPPTVSATPRVVPDSFSGTHGGGRASPSPPAADRVSPASHRASPPTSHRVPPEFLDYINDSLGTNYTQPREPPPRLRRTNHRRSPGPVNGHQHASMSSPPGSGPPTYAMPANYPYAQITGTPQLDTPSLAPRTASSVHPPPHTNDMRSPSNSASGYPAELPLIQSLPNGTSVMLIRPGEPKRAPWTIRDLGPQHHVKNDFDSWPVELQEQEMFNGAEGPYLPYDMYGNAVQIVWDERLGKYKHVFIHDRAWVNPVANGVRMDGPEHGRQPMVLGRERERVGRERVGDRDRDRERDRERERERDRDRDRDRDREMRDVGSAAPAGDGRLTPELSSGPGSATTRDARNGAGGAAGAGGSTPSGAAGGSAAGGFTAANR